MISILSHGDGLRKRGMQLTTEQVAEEKRYAAYHRASSTLFKGIQKLATEPW